MLHLLCVWSLRSWKWAKKQSRYRPGQAQKVDSGLVLSFRDLGDRTGVWLASRPGRFTTGKDPVTIVQEAGWTPGLENGAIPKRRETSINISSVTIQKAKTSCNWIPVAVFSLGVVQLSQYRVEGVHWIHYL
jgi:hypothetical protein